MKTTRIRTTAALMLLVGLAGGCVSNQTTPAGGQAATIEEVVGQVQQALASVQGKLAARKFPPLKEVKLTLQATATGKGGGSLKLWVVSIGASREKSQTEQIVLTLVPPPAGPPRLSAELSLTDELESAILSAADGIQKSREGPVPLIPVALDVEINFGVKVSGSGGASLIVAPVTVGASGGIDSSTTQTIKISFAVK